MAIRRYAKRAQPAPSRRPLRRPARRRKKQTQTRDLGLRMQEHLQACRYDVGGVTPPLPHPSHSTRACSPLGGRGDLRGSIKQPVRRRTTSPGVGTISVAYRPVNPCESANGVRERFPGAVHRRHVSCDRRSRLPGRARPAESSYEERPTYRVTCHRDTFCFHRCARRLLVWL